jgi:iron complex transport system substrate-binding protein
VRVFCLLFFFCALFEWKKEEDPHPNLLPQAGEGLRGRDRCKFSAFAGMTFICVASTPLAAAPRIVSINPCVDAVLVRVADPAQIAGISHYSQDAAATSIPLDIALRYKATSGTAEEVVALSPDIVIAGQHVSPSTIHSLQRMGIRLVKFPVPETIAESEAQVRAIAGLVEHPDRGERLVSAIEGAVTAARPARSSAVPALIWQAGGMVPGKGTLADTLLQTAGFRNLSASYGLRQWDILSLEYLVARPPRLLLSVGLGAGTGDRLLAHPVMQKLASRIIFRPYPPRLMHCGGPTIIDALARLTHIRKELGQP